MSSNDSFAALPKYLQRRVDRAFDQSAPSNDPNPTDSGGGFLVGDAESSQTQIPLAAIPTALQQLDLPPDDEEVLLVFKNAASGWQSTTNSPEEISDGAAGLYVSREDWRSVCGVLLEHRAEEYEDSDGTSPAAGADSDAADEDEYQEQDEPEADSDSDEYMEEVPFKSRRRTRSAKALRSRSSSSASSTSLPKSKRPTARQKKTCLDTYALFFPAVSEAELPDQRITVQDIQRLTKLIGDKLKGDEVLEMLGEFSTAPDRSMSLADFETMMMAAKLC
ncbi:hypothetical protein MSAN_00524000 [Mycena sanguinolenta]|uniref:Uncharacterized protein n=1 Tax=Mycena sanguinolenta TaxID=230812 RepID=A0A8H6Z9K2_9AGAR|nr:hypothetical protein MSAN_00524000 [Mycena sanguinolenta]